MSDFLVSLDKRYRGNDLLSLIKKPYGKRAPEGQSFDYSWGSVAVLNERLACNGNIIVRDGASFAWVGDLVMDSPEQFPQMFMNRLAGVHERCETTRFSLQTDDLFERLNGTFAIVWAADDAIGIITDPLSFVPVYMGRNKRGNVASFGTHPDLVQATCEGAVSVDIVSAAEFLNTGRSTFPNTMYTNVKQLNPGSLYCVHPEKSGRMRVQTFRYWSPPRELGEGFDIGEIAEELAQSITSAVKDRCGAGRVGVELSGGLDSRLISAAVPKEVECVALTFGYAMNRELKTARRVAKAYNRRWIPLFRDKEFLARCFIEAVRLAGCENEWMHAHGIGFVERIQEFGIEALIGGNGIDSFLKGYDAKDFVPVKRWGGLLAKRYVKIRFDYENAASPFWRTYLKQYVLQQMRARRREFYDDNLDPDRTSMAELLLNYPHSQNDCATFITVDRRLLPVRTCAADRRILDFAFKCPIELKLGNKVFFMAARRIYGSGLDVPSANDGVRPCSGHWWRLAQRAVRKLQDGATCVSERLGKEPRIQHSWHDYQKYWEESAKFGELIQEYGANLDQFNGYLFKGRGPDLRRRKDINWHYAFRLLQLAFWRSVVEACRPQ